MLDQRTITYKNLLTMENQLFGRSRILLMVVTLKDKSGKLLMLVQLLIVAVRVVLYKSTLDLEPAVMVAPLQ